MARKVGLERAQVIETAAALADARDPEPLTLQALATELGVQKPSLYNYVDGLPGLERELALVAARMMYERFAEAAIGKTRDDAVRAIAHTFRCFILEHPGLYTLSVHTSRNREPVDVELGEWEAKALSILVIVLSTYPLSKDELMHSIRGLRSLVHGFATLESSGGFGLPLSLEESFEKLVEMFLRGLPKHQDPPN